MGSEGAVDGGEAEGGDGGEGESPNGIAADEGEGALGEEFRGDGCHEEGVGELGEIAEVVGDGAGEADCDGWRGRTKAHHH